jgi:hypothetical protein
MPIRPDEHRGASMEMGGLSTDLGKNGISHSKIYYNEESDTIHIGDDPGRGWELIGWVES